MERKKSPCIVRIHRVIHFASATAFVQFQAISRGSRDNGKNRNKARREATDAAAAKKTAWTRPILKGWNDRMFLFVDLIKVEAT